MKKNTKTIIFISAFILAAAVVFTFSACTKNKKTNESTTTSSVVEYEATAVTFKTMDNSRFTLAINKTVITNLNEKIGLALSYVPNDDNDIYTFKSDFALQLMTDAGWRAVQLDYDIFEEIVYELSPTSRVHAQEIVLSEHFNMLKNGKYRIVKLINDAENNNIGAFAEIEIKLPANADETTTERVTEKITTTTVPDKNVTVTSAFSKKDEPTDIYSGKKFIYDPYIFEMYIYNSGKSYVIGSQFYQAEKYINEVNLLFSKPVKQVGLNVDDALIEKIKKTSKCIEVTYFDSTTITVNSENKDKSVTVKKFCYVLDNSKYKGYIFLGDKNGYSTAPYKSAE